jgi:hypothetical protein
MTPERISYYERQIGRRVDGNVEVQGAELRELLSLAQTPEKTCRWQSEPDHWVRGCDGGVQNYQQGPHCHMCGGKVVIR